jgi:hypothetical protein
MMRSFAVRQVAPDEDHGGAGRGGQDDAAGDVLIGVRGGDPRAEDDLEEEPGEGRHREGLHQPVHEEGYEQAPGFSADLANGAEVDLHHHRRDHQPDEDGDRDVDLAALTELEATERVHHSRRGATEQHPHHHAQAHPEAQVALEDSKSLCGRGRGHSQTPFSRALKRFRAAGTMQ